MNLILAITLSYLIGSIPFGVLLTRTMKLGDVQKIGSGNIGATNVLRTGNKTAATATLILDMLKGLVAFVIINHTNASLSGIAFFFVILGHCFPVWLQFKGGKGVATYIGGLLGLFWVLGVIAICVWLIVAITKKISSLAALVMVIMMPFFALLFTPYYAIWIGAASGLVIYRHATNITRLRSGDEPKIGDKTEK